MNKLKTFLSISVLTLTGLTTSIPAQALDLGSLFSSKTTQNGKFLAVEDAFAVNPSVQGNKLSVTFDITNGHYVYRDKLKLNLPNGVTASKLIFDQTPNYIDDPNFGRVAVFDQSTVTATTTLSNTTSSDSKSAPISIKWQGCAKAGLCYPPEKINLTVNLKKK